MKNILELSLVIALIWLPMRSPRRSSDVVGVLLLITVAFFAYILYIAPRIPG
jgi:hypothetical protein